MKRKIIAICVGVMALAGCNSKIKDAVRERLKDPSSAKFEAVVRNDSRACVIFDAKNPLGVYTGNSTAQLKNLADKGGDEQWLVESIDDSTCSDFDLRRKLDVDHEDEASANNVLQALKDSKLVPSSVKNVNEVAYGTAPCSPFVSDLMTNARVSHSTAQPEKKARYEKTYEGGLAQIKLGICRYENGSWTVESKKSEIDDSENVTVGLPSTAPVISHSDSVQPSLIVRCAQGKTNVYITWSLFLGTDQTSVLTRLDKEPAQTSNWSLSTDNKATFVPGSDEAFAKQLLEHKQLLAQVTPYSESPVTATFELEGLDHAIEPLRKACHW